MNLNNVLDNVGIDLNYLKNIQTWFENINLTINSIKIETFNLDSNINLNLNIISTSLSPLMDSLTFSEQSINETLNNFSSLINSLTTFIDYFSFLSINVMSESIGAYSTNIPKKISSSLSSLNIICDFYKNNP